VTNKTSRELVRRLVSAVIWNDPEDTTWALACLHVMSGPQWLHADQLARGSYHTESLLGAVAGWHERPAWHEWLLGAVAASMVCDGRVREAAVAVLAGTPGQVASAALAVRTSDWVPEVRAAAVAAVSSRAGADEVAAIVPVMIALHRRRRWNQGASEYLASLEVGPAETLAALARPGGHGACRTWALCTLAERGLLGAGDLIEIASRDRDPLVAMCCARLLTPLAGGGPADAWPRVLRSARCASVRAYALGSITDGQLPREELRRLVLDKSGAVRSKARWRWARRWGSLAPVWQEALGATRTATEIAAALEGMDEGHDGSLPGAAIPFLTHPSPRVRCAAMRAVARHGTAEDKVAHLAPLLLADSARVARTARQYLRGWTLPPAILATLDAAGTPRSRRTALSIRQHLGTWDRVHADLVAASGPDLDLATAARSDLRSWLRNGAGTAYARLGPGRAAEITALLPASGLTRQQCREIAIVARLPGGSTRHN
jgi:hypothetical protein